jgi:uncharacterized protein (UPF0332 family)
VLEPNVGDLGYFLVQCPSCKEPIFCQAYNQSEDFSEWHWGTAERLWPVPSDRQLPAAIPLIAAKDIKDAQKCLHHGIYSAAVVLCGRALEYLIREKTEEKMIARGLKALVDSGIIDKKLYEWADALREERNLGTHATGQEVTKENAEDILDFTIAIYNYVYTLTNKYEQYKARKKG